MIGRSEVSRADRRRSLVSITLVTGGDGCADLDMGTQELLTVCSKVENKSAPSEGKNQKWERVPAIVESLA